MIDSSDLVPDYSKDGLKGHQGIDIYPGQHLHIEAASIQERGSRIAVPPRPFIQPPQMNCRYSTIPDMKGLWKRVLKGLRKARPILLNGEPLEIEPSKGPEL